MEQKKMSLKEQIIQVKKEEPNVRRDTVRIVRMWTKEYFQGFAELTGDPEIMQLYEKEVQPRETGTFDLVGFAIAEEFEAVNNWEQGENSLLKRILIDPFCKL